MLVALCAHVVPRYAERHVLIPISCASLLGSLTVLASKAVSTFVQLTLAGIADPDVPFSDQVSTSRQTLAPWPQTLTPNPSPSPTPIPLSEQVDLTKGEEACLSDGHHYGIIAPASGRLGCVTVDPWYEAAHPNPTPNPNPNPNPTPKPSPSP